MNRPIVIGILLFLIAASGLLFLMKRRSAQTETITAPPPAATLPAAVKQPEGQSTERRITVLLFFNAKNSDRLTTEDRHVPYRDTLRDQAFEVMKELVRGPSDGLIATVPPETQVRELFVTRDGTAYVDFSPELASRHVGGSLSEINTVYSIVNTLTLNFPQVKRVQILVDDHAVDTLTGHVDLSRPLMQNLSIVDTRPAAPPATSTPESTQSEPAES